MTKCAHKIPNMEIGQFMINASNNKEIKKWMKDNCVNKTQLKRALKQENDPRYKELIKKWIKK